MNTDDGRPRLAWAVTGSGHYLRECLALALEHPATDLFLSAAAAEVLTMYGYSLSNLRRRVRIFRDTTASAPPVGLFYEGHYHTLVIAPATSNTIAKCVYGISDSLVTNIYAQAGKCRIPSIVFACDTQPYLESEAPRGTVMVHPRRIDLDNVERLRDFDFTHVVADIDALRAALGNPVPCPTASCS